MRRILWAVLAAGLYVLLCSGAQGQSSAGLRANDTSTAEPARMHDPGVTPNLMVDGQNPEGAPAKQSFLPWPDAVALGRIQYRDRHTPVPLGDVAREYRGLKYRTPVPAKPIVNPPAVELPKVARDPFKPGL